jgi:hypothetical protein
MARAQTVAIPQDHRAYGQRLGEGAARHFSIVNAQVDLDQQLRLMPLTDSFICPISQAVLQDPVATVDGCVYERLYIERWFQIRLQQREPVTSPGTGLELQSMFLLPLEALRHAIETYMAHRPELKQGHVQGRSFEEAASLLQNELLEKQAVHGSIQDEIEISKKRLIEAETMIEALQKALGDHQRRESQIKGCLHEAETSNEVLQKTLLEMAEVQEKSNEALQKTLSEMPEVQGNFQAGSDAAANENRIPFWMRPFWVGVTSASVSALITAALFKFAKTNLK